MVEPLLSGVRVLDMTTGRAGPVAALLLAEAGADVVKVEPPGNGDRDRPGFRTWNRSKRSIVVDLDGPAGRDDLDRLLATADVLVHELAPSAARRAGLADDDLASRHPHLVVSSVLGWPANHPDAERPVDELLTLARLGILDEQFAMRREGPVYVRVPLGSVGASYLTAIGVLARLRARDRTGRGGPAHTSLVQGALVPMGMHWARAERPSEGLATGMTKASRGSQATLFECGDGGWFHLMGNPAQSPEVAQALGAGQDMASIFLSRPRQEWLDELWAHDVPVQPALDFGAVLDDEQARANGYVVTVDDPELGPVTMPGNPLTTTPPCVVRWPAPAAGEHDAEVRAEWGSAAPASSSLAPGGESLRWPLEGLRVLDLGAYLAGPYGPMVLSDLGADVVKVESVTGDAMRPGDWAFAGCQRGKRSVSLDLKSPAARPALDALIRWADVVHHNLRMPAARRLGLGPEDVLAVNPRVVYCHTSSYGPAGPRADWPGYDQLFQALCGWEVLGAGEGNPPMWHRFGFMDHQCALSSVVATLLALRRRDETGEGQVVNASLLGAGVLTTGEAVRLADGTLTPVARVDADQTGITPGRRIVACADGWVALSTDRTDLGGVIPSVTEDLQALAVERGITSEALMGALTNALESAYQQLPEAIADARVVLDPDSGDFQVFAQERDVTPPDFGRIAAQTAKQVMTTRLRVADGEQKVEGTDGVAGWKTAELLARLEEAGIPAELVREQQRDPFFDSEANRAAGLVASYEHGQWGQLEQPGALWWFGDLDVHLHRAPPLLGEHTAGVLAEAGLDADAVRALVTAGAAVAADLD